MRLVSISKSNRKWPKIAKTKIFRQNAYMWLSEAKGNAYMWLSETKG